MRLVMSSVSKTRGHVLYLVVWFYCLLIVLSLRFETLPRVDDRQGYRPQILSTKSLGKDAQEPRGTFTFSLLLNLTGNRTQNYRDGAESSRDTSLSLTKVTAKCFSTTRTYHPIQSLLRIVSLLRNLTTHTQHHVPIDGNEQRGAD